MAGAGAGIPQISDRGQSVSNQRYISRSLELAALFLVWTHTLEDTYKGFTTWPALPAAIHCSKTIYQQLPHYLMNVYTYKRKADDDDETLALSTQAKTLRYLLNWAKSRYERVVEHAEFFKCLEPGSKSWLSQVERNVEADMFARNLLAGVKTVDKATPM